ncbi:MAG: energy transducer TonB [Chitinophagales bacterium]
MLYFLIILLSPALIIIFLKLFYLWQSPEKIRKKHHNTAISISQKVYPEADTEKFRFSFLQIGLIISMLWVMYAFNYAATDDVGKDLIDNGMFEDFTEVLPPQTKHTPPPPPKPLPPPKLEIVEDEIEIEEEPEILDTEVEADTEIEIPIDIFEDIDEGDLEIDIVEEPIKEAEPEEPEIFTIVEEMPEFVGGTKKMYQYLSKNLNYPRMAQENSIEGKVFVTFVVMENGSISEPQIARGIAGGGAGCDAEALRVVSKMPKWKAGKQRGKAVKVRFTLPIVFKLH